MAFFTVLFIASNYQLTCSCHFLFLSKNKKNLIARDAIVEGCMSVHQSSELSQTAQCSGDRELTRPLKGELSCAALARTQGAPVSQRFRSPPDP